VTSVMTRFRRAGERQHTWDPKLADAAHWTCTRCGVMRMRNTHNDIKEPYIWYTIETHWHEEPACELPAELPKRKSFRGRLEKPIL
jgi:hypothetical protein